MAAETVYRECSTEEHLTTSVQEIDVTDPENPQIEIVDLVTDDGYANNDRTTDITKRFVGFFMRQRNSGQFATVLIGGVPTIANGIGFWVKSAHPTIPILSLNYPDAPGNYSCWIESYKQNGADYSIIEWEVICQKAGS